MLANLLLLLLLRPPPTSYSRSRQEASAGCSKNNMPGPASQNRLLLVRLRASDGALQLATVGFRVAADAGQVSSILYVTRDIFTSPVS